MNLGKITVIAGCLVAGLSICLGTEGGLQDSMDDRSRNVAADTFPSVVIPDTERRELPSAIVDEVFKLHVYFPRGYEEQYRARSEALAARVFFAAGEDDGPNILQDTDRMQKVLGERRYRGMDYRVRFFPEETHRTVFPIAVTHGLRFVFGDAAAGPASNAEKAD
jgi:hypothetical protein